MRKRLTFDPYRVWPKVQHLFYGPIEGEWAEGVEIVTSFTAAITVSMPLEMEALVRSILDAEEVRYMVA